MLILAAALAAALVLAGLAASAWLHERASHAETRASLADAHAQCQRTEKRLQSLAASMGALGGWRVTAAPARRQERAS